MPVLNRLDKSSPIPIYYQLKEQLALLIRDGVYPVGSRLPSELEISETLNISRGTVRQAINALVSEGRLERVQGSGTFVRQPPQAVLNLTGRFTSFAEEMRDQHLEFTSKVLSKKIIPAEGRLLGKLLLQEGDKVVFLERLGTLQGEPFVLSFAYIPHFLCPDLLKAELEDQALYDVFESEYGHILQRATRTLDASVADEYEAQHLHIEVGSPIHFMHSLAYLDDGTPIEYNRLRFRGDRSRITFDVYR